MPTQEQYQAWARMNDRALTTELIRVIHHGRVGASNEQLLEEHFGGEIAFPQTSSMFTLRENVRAFLQTVCQPQE